MKALFAIRSKFKLGLGLLMLVVLLLCGVLVERNFFSRVDEASTSIYKDRLVPSTAVYHLGDHMAQRRFILESLAREKREASPEVRKELRLHEEQMDSITQAFEKTYLVKKESESLDLLKKHLAEYSKVEQSLLTRGSPYSLQPAFASYNEIRIELNRLSKIQTRIGQNFLNETHSITTNAGILSQIQIIALIITCLVAQAFLLASKAINSPLKQRHNLN